MLEVIFLFVFALIWVMFALVQDIRTTEIANWVSFSLIIFALGFRFFYSLFSSGGFGFFYYGLIGLAVFYALGNLLYNAKMFAGGDAKLFIALGAVLPVSGGVFSTFENYLFFLFIFLIAGAVYSLMASFILCIRHYKGFKKEFWKQFKKKKMLVNMAILAAIIIALLGLVISNILFYFAILIFIIPYLYLFAKAVDESTMIIEINTGELREGDWLYRDVKVKRKTIRATWDGLSRTDISFLRKHKKKVLIRKGVPFTGTFLISVIIYFYFLISTSGNPFW